MKVLGAFLLLVEILACECAARPHIIFILADDVGWNDLSFHGSSEIFTPNIDSLAYSGVILNRYYVSPLCTPSRAALMTGKHPIYTGNQHNTLSSAEPRGLSLNETLLPEYLRQLGYSNHMLGKWHLGSYKRAYTPLSRGFDSHFGFWSRNQDQFDHTSLQFNQRGLDMRRNWDSVSDYVGNFTTDLLTDEATEIILRHKNSSQPLFLYVAQASAHSGNSDNRFNVPASSESLFRHIPRRTRRRYAASVYHLDLCVAEIVEALEKSDMLHNSIIVFSTDNGGSISSASNYPLRGEKATLWEGGVRGAGFIWSLLLRYPQRVSNQMIHVADWLPTILGAVDGNFDLKGIDGLNLWEEISTGMKSKRIEVLHNINDITGLSSITVGKYKLVQGSVGSDDWTSVKGNLDPSSYQVTRLLESRTAVILSRMNQMPVPDKILSLRSTATLNCNNKVEKSCRPAEKPCLFNTEEDPCELENLADLLPDVLASVSERLKFYNSTAIPPANLPRDPRGFPSNWNNTWTNWGDLLGLP